MATVDPESFLGTGWAYPIQVDSRTQGIKTSSGENSVRESIRLIIGTTIGSRIMRRDFGSMVNDRIFDPADDDFVNQMVSEVERAILQFEPRIRAISASGTHIGSRVDIQIQYKLVATNASGNLVYPFFFEEQSA